MADFERRRPGLEARLTDIEASLDQPVQFDDADTNRHRAAKHDTEVDDFGGESLAVGQCVYFMFSEVINGMPVNSFLFCLWKKTF